MSTNYNINTFSKNTIGDMKIQKRNAKVVKSYIFNII